MFWPTHPIPLYALKLLGGAVEADEGGGFDGGGAGGMAPAFFEFLSLEHTNNNVHNVRLCLALASSDAVPVEKLREYGAGGKVAAVLRYAHENAVEPFLEPALEMCRAVLRRAGRARTEGEAGRPRRFKKRGAARGARADAPRARVRLGERRSERWGRREARRGSLGAGDGAPPNRGDGRGGFPPRRARLAERVDAMGTVAARATSAGSRSRAASTRGGRP